jgi:hypothetical protein
VASDNTGAASNHLHCALSLFWVATRSAGRGQYIKRPLRFENICELKVAD